MFTRITPILRIFDVKKAIEFYVDYLGFRVDWEHRFESGMPLYMQLSRGDIVLHLSEHHGDATPGSAIRVETTQLDNYHEELTGRAYAYYNPSIEATPWNLREMRLIDPFGNRLVFYEPGMN